MSTVVEALDLFPTLTDLAGVPQPKQARSMLANFDTDMIHLE